MLRACGKINHFPVQQTVEATVMQTDQQKHAAAEGACVIVCSVDVYDIVCVGGGGGGRCEYTLW